jgi:hypothetical protein
MIASDALGKIGEQTFGLLCAGANMTFNQSQTWDRAGWDFVVDFGAHTLPGATLDQQPSPRNCRIQVKTVGANKTAAEVSLKMAERLAKDAGPSFVLAFQVDDNNTVGRAYLIPMLNAPLAQVLEGLRKASLKDNGRLGTKRLRFKLADATPIDVTGTALKAALLDHIGPDIHAYVARKKHQLDHLGYDERSFEGRFTVPAHLQGTFEQMLLGRPDRMKVYDFEVHRRRFGMTEVVEPASDVEMSITPHPIDTAVVTVRSVGTAPLVFEGDVFATPKRLGGSVRIVLPLFDLLLSGRQRNQFHLSFQLLNKAATPAEWLAFWTAVDAIQQGTAVVEVRSTKLAIHEDLQSTGARIRLDTTLLANNLQLCRDLASIATQAGWPSSIVVPPRAITERNVWIDYMARIIDGTQQTVRFRTPSDEPPDQGSEEPAVFVCYFPIADCVVACCARVQLAWSRADGNLVFDLTQLQFRQIVLLASGTEVRAFVDRAKAREQVARDFVMGDEDS